MFRNENRPILLDRAAGEPTLERVPCGRQEIGDAMLIAFAVDAESRRVSEKDIFKRKIMNFSYSQPTFEHEAEHGLIARVLNM